MITTPEKIIWRLLIRVHFKQQTVQIGKKVLKCHREANSRDWQGAMLNLSKKLEGGATYRVSFTAYSEVSSLNFNEQVIPIEGGDESYSYMPTRITATRWKTTKGQWKDFDYEITVPDDMYFYGFYFQSDDGTTGDMYVDNMKIVKTAQPSKATDIPKLKDIYSDTFWCGSCWCIGKMIFLEIQLLSS